MMIGTKVQKAYNSHICPKYPKAAPRKGLFLKTLKKAEGFIAVAGDSDDIAAWYAALKVFGHYINDEHYAQADALLMDTNENPEN